MSSRAQKDPGNQRPASSPSPHGLRKQPWQSRWSSPSPSPCPFRSPTVSLPIPCWHLHLQLGKLNLPTPTLPRAPSKYKLWRPSFCFAAPFHLLQSSGELFWIPSFSCYLPPTPLSPNHPFPCTKGRGVQPRWRRHLRGQPQTGALCPAPSLARAHWAQEPTLGSPPFLLLPRPSPNSRSFAGASAPARASGGASPPTSGTRDGRRATHSEGGSRRPLPQAARPGAVGPVQARACGKAAPARGRPARPGWAPGAYLRAPLRAWGQRLFQPRSCCSLSGGGGGPAGAALGLRADALPRSAAAQAAAATARPGAALNCPTRAGAGLRLPPRPPRWAPARPASPRWGACARSPRDAPGRGWARAWLGRRPAPAWPRPRGFRLLTPPAHGSWRRFTRRGPCEAHTLGRIRRDHSGLRWHCRVSRSIAFKSRLPGVRAPRGRAESRSRRGGPLAEPGLSGPRKISWQLQRSQTRGI